MSGAREVMQTWMYETAEASVMLMYILAGIEAHRKVYPKQPGVDIPPELPGIEFFPVVSAPNSDELFNQQSTIVQMAYKGWIEQVYRDWEKTHRKGIYDAMSDIEFVRSDVMGDLRLIRNDFFHSGIASAEKSGKCEVLRWFEPGNRIVLTFNHLLDFLNQTGLLTAAGVMYNERNSAVCVFRPSGRKEVLLNWEPIPTLISVRTSDAKKPNCVLLNIVYDNGFFTTIGTPVRPGTFVDSSDMEKGRLEKSRGRVVFPNGYTLRVGDLYTQVVEAHFDPEGRENGIPGPSIRFVE